MTALVTADELLTMPDDKRRELIEGVLHEMNRAGADHGTVAFELAGLMRDYAREHGGRGFGAETGFVLASAPDTVRAPDAAYVSPERATPIGRTPGFWRGAPDFGAEVISPSDTFSATQDKALMWLAHGTSVVLVIDPVSRRVTRYRSLIDTVTFVDAPDRIDCAPAMPGFAPALGDLFPF